MNHERGQLPISIITVTYQRRALLAEKLETLKAQTLAPEKFEWLVCVNADDGSLEMLESVKASLAFRLITIDAGSNVGIAKGRNLGAQQAQGQFLLLSDDDCMLTENLLFQHLQQQQQQPCVALGDVIFADHKGRQQRAKKWDFVHVNGANSSLPRSVFEQVGGFDERLVGYGGEDLLLGYLLKQYGLEIVFIPDAVVYHRGPDPRAGRDLAKARSAGYNAVQIAQRHPELAAYLGVSAELMRLKKWLYASPLGLSLRLLRPGRFAYERAYYQGAVEALQLS